MMKRVWFLALAVSVGLNAGLLLYPVLSRNDEVRVQTDPPDIRDQQRPPDGDRRSPPPRRSEDVERVIQDHIDRMTNDLGLDRQQQSAIGTVHERLLPQILSERREMDGLRQVVASLYGQSTIDSTELRAVVQQLSDAQERLDSLTIDAMLGEAAVLTHEQRLHYLREMPWGHPMPPPDRPDSRRRELRPEEPRGKPPRAPEGERRRRPPRKKDEPGS